MFYYLIENHMQKFRHFGGKQNFTRKSHLRLCCTKPFNYLANIRREKKKGRVRAHLCVELSPSLIQYTNALS